MRKIFTVLLFVSGWGYASPECPTQLSLQWEMQMVGELVEFVESHGGQPQMAFGLREFLVHAARVLELEATAHAISEAEWNVMDGHLVLESPWARRRFLLAFGNLVQATHVKNGGSPQPFPSTMAGIHQWATETGLSARLVATPPPRGTALTWSLGGPPPGPRRDPSAHPPRLARPTKPAVPLRSKPATKLDRAIAHLRGKQAVNVESDLVLILNTLSEDPELFLTEAQIERLGVIWDRYRSEEVRDLVVAVCVHGARDTSPMALNLFRAVLLEGSPSAIEITVDPRFRHLAASLAAEEREKILSMGSEEEDETAPEETPDEPQEASLEAGV